MIVLSLTLATVSMGSAYAAIYTGGTHDIGGNITPTESLVSNDNDVTLNAASDVNIDTNNSWYKNRGPAGYHEIAIMKGTHSVNVIMNNHNWTSGNYGFLAADEGAFNISNAYDVNATSKNANLINVDDKSAHYSLQANHDITLVSSYPAVYVGSGGAQANIIAGHNVSIGNGTDVKAAEALALVDTIGGSSINVTAENDVALSSSGSHYTIIAIGNSTNNSSSVNVTAKDGNLNINSAGNEGASVFSRNGATTNLIAGKSLTVGGSSQSALKVNTGGIINATANTGIITLTATNTDSTNAGIYALNNGIVNLHSDTIVNAIANGVLADGGTVTFDKGITISGAPTAIAASNAGKVTAADASSAKKITGNITSDGTGSSVDANFMTADSYLTGTTTISNDSAINLEFGNGGTWNVTGDSSLTKLTTNSNGVVNMDYTGAGNYNTITTQNYTGNGGTIVMDTDIQKSKDTYDVRQNSDKLVINGTSSGTTYISIKDASKLSGTPAEGYVLLVEDKTSGGATFVGKSLEDSGIYKYKPVITAANPADNYAYSDGAHYTGYTANNAKNWYLASFTRDGLQPAVVPDIAAGAEKYISYRHELDNLLLRLGELRDYENSDGIWARIRHSTGTADAYGLGNSHFTMYQLGYDHRYQNDSENGRRYFGGAFDYMRGTQDYDAVNADSRSHTYSLSLYDTWLGTKGHYLDLIGKVGRIDRAFNYHGTYADSGSDQAWYYSLSAEYGRKIMNGNGLYWEPQTQLTYGHINGSDYTTDTQGIKVESDSINSLIWRVGTTFGKYFGGNVDGQRSNVYVKVFWNREFLGNSDGNLAYYTDAYDYTNHYRGNWWTIGVGANWQLSTKTNAYVDLSKDFGGDFNNKYQMNVGIRWSWGD